MTPDLEIGRIFPLPEGRDAAGFITELARVNVEDRAEAAACAVRDARVEYYPSDALVVDVDEAYRRRTARQDEETAHCGPFGVGCESISYWRVGQGFAWFFDFGQSLADVDAGSMVLMRRASDGSWEVVA